MWRAVCVPLATVSPYLYILKKGPPHRTDCALVDMLAFCSLVVCLNDVSGLREVISEVCVEVTCQWLSSVYCQIVAFILYTLYLFLSRFNFILWW